MWKGGWWQGEASSPEAEGQAEVLCGIMHCMVVCSGVELRRGH